MKLIVIGYDFEENASDLEEKLVKDILKEDAELVGKVKIVWKKSKAENKKSLIILKTGNRWTRENILRNQRPGKNFIVKRSIPKNFRDVESQLKERA